MITCSYNLQTKNKLVDASIYHLRVLGADGKRFSNWFVSAARLLPNFSMYVSRCS